MNSLLIAGNIVKRLFRNPAEVIALVIMPVLIIVGLTMAFSSSFSTGQTTTSVIILDQDGTQASVKLCDYLKTQKDFSFTAANNQDMDLNKLKASIANGDYDAALTIPKGFENSVSSAQAVNSTLYILNDSTGAQLLRVQINGKIVAFLEAEKLAQKLSQVGSKPADGKTATDLTETEKVLLSDSFKTKEADDSGNNNEQTVQTPKMNTTMIGFMLMFMMTLIFTTIGVILEDKRKLTLARMFVAPVKEWEIIAGNLIGSLVLGVIQLVPILVVMKFLFEIDSLLVITEVGLILFCFLIATIGLGIGLSGFFKKGFNPIMIVATVITPTCILGGCFIPDSMLPDIVNKFGYVVPQKWVMNALNAINNGAGFDAIMMNLVIVLMFGLVFATFGLKTLRPINE